MEHQKSYFWLPRLSGVTMATSLSGSIRDFLKLSLNVLPYNEILKAFRSRIWLNIGNKHFQKRTLVLITFYKVHLLSQAHLILNSNNVCKDNWNWNMLVLVPFYIQLAKFCIYSEKLLSLKSLILNKCPLNDWNIFKNPPPKVQCNLTGVCSL